MRNPLTKRIPRELKEDWKKYLVVALFLILTIGFVSGMYVANGSMMQSAAEGKEKYRLEDGHFEVEKKADRELICAIETGKQADVKQFYLDQTKKELIDPDFSAVPVNVYENFYRNETEDHDNDGNSDGTIRVYEKNDDINLACLMEGSSPERESEIAIDRMHADNVGIQVGDMMTVGGQRYQVTGLISYVNYATLHEKTTDLMFDALKFNVAMVTKDGFERLSGTVHYTYAWKYEQAPADEIEEKKQSDDFMKALVTQTVVWENELQDYVESQTIGTLRASGYTKGELVRHYLAMPVIVTVIAAFIGNLLGYTVLKNVVVSMYYNSYSLPAYETIWNPNAFFKTTVIPVFLMFAVNLIVITRMMQHTPLQFLRRDLKKTRRKKTVRLPKWKFFSRFRLRIIFQNIPNYIVLFAGIFFITVMLEMAVGMPSTLNYYQDNAENLMFAKYQYILKSCKDEEGQVIHTDNQDAEQLCMKALKKTGDALDEEVSVYGIRDDSRYIRIENLSALKENEVYLSRPFSEKYSLKAGDIITLDEKYENKQYRFKVVGIYEKCQNIAVFLPIANYRSLFELDKEEFTGYMSDTEVTDLEEDEIATVITKEDITKMCDQLDHSMGAYMQYFQILCTLLSAVLIYLLTKLIIEKNEKAISMTKILGYENREIASLYLLSTTMVVIAADVISVILSSMVMTQIWKVMMSGYSGWFAFVIEPVGYVKMFLFVFIGYMIVLVLDFRRIRKIPMEEAMKNAE